MKKHTLWLYCVGSPPSITDCHVLGITRTVKSTHLGLRVEAETLTAITTQTGANRERCRW